MALLRLVGLLHRASCLPLCVEPRGRAAARLEEARRRAGRTSAGRVTAGRLWNAVAGVSKDSRSTAPHDTPWEYAWFWGPNRLAAPSGAVLPCGGPRCRNTPGGDLGGRPVGRPGAAPAVRGRRCARPANAVVSPVSFPFPASHPALRRRADRVLMDAKHIWRAALGELQVALSPANFETWLRHTSLVDVDDTRFRIAVPNGFAKDWLETRYRPLISQTLARIVGYSVQVEFLVREDAGQPAAAPSEAPAAAGPRRADARRRGGRLVEPEPAVQVRRTSSSARPTGSPTRRPSRSPSARATPTTRSSSTAGWAWARPT